MSRRLAILHHARSFFPLDLYRAIGDDIEPLWVLIDDASEDPTARRLLPRLGTVIDIAGLDLDDAAGRLATQQPAGIVTFVDDNLESAAGLAARLGLTYHSPEVAATLASKPRQRAALAAGGVAGPRFWTLPAAIELDALRALAHRIRYPAVLKPAAGSGSRGIFALFGPEDVLTFRLPGVEQLVEEYLDDDPTCDPRFASYLSLESVVSYGRISHVAITGRFPLADPFRETGNFIPAAVRPSLHRALIELTDAAIEAVGITTGVLHTEIKLTSAGPKLIEINGRLGGRPPFVLRSVSDTNLFRVACELALGTPTTFPDLASCRGVGYWRMLQPPLTARRVREVRGLAAISEAPHVDSLRLNHPPSDTVDWREGTEGQVVTVQGHVDDFVELADAIAFIDRTVEIDYDNAVSPAADSLRA
jgi:biotin carboxylase